MATRKEFTGIRDLTFSQWVRNRLPDSNTGFSVSDLDFILWNWKTKKVMMLEIKTRNSYPRKGQKMMWRNINKWIKKGIDDDWTYLDFNLITFENTNFEDGKCFLNNNEIKEEELIEFLSFY
jgi:hypothetical protein